MGIKLGLVEGVFDGCGEGTVVGICIGLEEGFLVGNPKG